MASDSSTLLGGRYIKVRELGHGAYGRAWLVSCAADTRLPSGARLRKGQQLVAKIISIAGA
jgi:hypothetical protein